MLHVTPEEVTSKMNKIKNKTTDDTRLLGENS